MEETDIQGRPANEPADAPEPAPPAAAEEPRVAPAAGEPSAPPTADEPPVSPAAEDPRVALAAEEAPAPPSAEEPPVSPAAEEAPAPPTTDERVAAATEEPASTPDAEQAPAPPIAEEPPVSPAAEEAPAPPTADERVAPAAEEPTSTPADEEAPVSLAAEEPTSTPADEEPPVPPAAEEPVSADELLATADDTEPEVSAEDQRLKAVLEAVVYIAEEPLSLEQIAGALGQPLQRIRPLLDRLVEEYDRPEHGLTIREVAGGYKMATKPEHHEAVRNFVKSLKPPLKLSLAALETLAVIAYKQPVTGPEIMDIRGVQGAGVLKTLLDRKLIAAAGRKNVIGKPILYKTTKDFLVQFGLKDLAELPTLKEFEEIGRMALGDAEPALEAAPPAAEAPPEAPEPPFAAAESEPPPAVEQAQAEPSAVAEEQEAGAEQP